MEFLTVRELTTKSKETWGKLAREGELVITNDGKPIAIIMSVSEGAFEKTIQFIRQTRMMRALNNIWDETDKRAPMSDEEIDAEIKAACAELNLE